MTLINTWEFKKKIVAGIFGVWIFGLLQEVAQPTATPAPAREPCWEAIVPAQMPARVPRCREAVAPAGVPRWEATALGTKTGKPPRRGGPPGRCRGRKPRSRRAGEGKDADGVAEPVAMRKRNNEEKKLGSPE